MPVSEQPATAWHLSISRKVVLLFVALALACAGSWVVMHRTMAQLDGAATDINRYGSLRYLSQKIQLALHDAAAGRDARAETERLIADFETHLMAMETARGVSDSGLGLVRAAWLLYRDAARGFVERRDVLPDPPADLRALSAQAEAVLREANRATWALSEQVGRMQGRARTRLLEIALFNGVILILAYVYVRRRVALPLRDLDAVTRRFAGGDYAVRSGFRSHDEIGRLAESFDFMAGETARHIGIIAADLDDIRRKEAELRKLSQAVEHSPASVVITDAAGNIEYVNPRFVEATGYSREEVIGRKPSLLQSGQTLPETYRALWETIRAGGTWRGELLNRKKSGELFWENTQISPVCDAQGEITHIVAVKEDITARKRAEEALALLNVELEQRVAARTRQLEHANRELQDFSHSVSFDLRTPLRAIQGFAEAVEEDAADGLAPETADYLRRIQAAAVRMGELIDDLLELGRVGQIDFMAQPVDLSRMARDILDELAHGEPGRRVETAVEPNIFVSGDPRLLRIALENLLGNAWKFTRGRDPAEIVFERTPDLGGNVLRVRDNGVGFNMDYAGRLFQPFQRLHAAGRFEGTGIGLATVKRIVELHGGRIRAESAPDQGAEFYFDIPEPLSPEERQALEARATEGEHAP